MNNDWHPRGTPSWPDWKSATPGTRVQHVRTRRQGTFHRAVTAPRTGRPLYAIIEWDARQGMRPAIGRVVAPAFDLRPV